MKKKYREGDRVKVIAGNYKKSEGVILKIYKKEGFVKIKGLNIKKHFIKKNKQYPMGAILEIEGKIHISNIIPKSILKKKEKEYIIK